jgi:hypothetical protein
MGIIETFLNSIADRLVSRMIDVAKQPVVNARAYYAGNQPEQLRVGPTQFNDNIVLNFTRLITQRIVSQMLGQGVTFDFEGETQTEQETWLNACLNANKQEVLFHRAALAASLAGTGYLYLSPNGMFGKDEVEYPRIQLYDPLFVTMTSMPDDFEIIMRYNIEYRSVDVRGKEIGRRRVIEQDDGGIWFTRDYISTNYGARWELTQETPFLDKNGSVLSFPPILYWQNLPSIDSSYGESDITPNIEAVQDRINFLSSNISKIIRFYAHPQRFAKMLGQTNKVEVGPDEMLNFNDPNGGMFQLDPLGDLGSSLVFLRTTRQALFDMARVMDIDSLQDKLGSLTNFGLRVLYQDNLAMIGTKRELFGDMLEELTRRLQLMQGYKAIEATIVWPEMLPTDMTEKTASEQALQTMGVISKQTIAANHELDWDEEQARIDKENTQNQNVPNEWYTETGASAQGQATVQNGRATESNQPGNGNRPGNGPGNG